MSDAHATHGPAAGGGGLESVIKSANQLISPRENVVSSTIAQNMAGFAWKTWDLLKSATATVVDIPLGIAEAAVALPNNLVGLGTKFVDKAVTQPIDRVRASIFKVINNPSTLLGGSGGAAHVAPAHP